MPVIQVRPSTPPPPQRPISSALTSNPAGSNRSRNNSHSRQSGSAASAGPKILTVEELKKHAATLTEETFKKEVKTYLDANNNGVGANHNDNMNIIHLCKAYFALNEFCLIALEYQVTLYTAMGMDRQVGYFKHQVANLSALLAEKARVDRMKPAATSAAGNLSGLERTPFGAASAMGAAGAATAFNGGALLGKKSLAPIPAEQQHQNEGVGGGAGSREAQQPEPDTMIFSRNALTESRRAMKRSQPVVLNEDERAVAEAQAIERLANARGASATDGARVGVNTNEANGGRFEGAAAAAVVPSQPSFAAELMKEQEPKQKSCCVIL